jgi:hypothetical protein
MTWCCSHRWGFQVRLALRESRSEEQYAQSLDFIKNQLFPVHLRRSAHRLPVFSTDIQPLVLCAIKQAAPDVRPSHSSSSSRQYDALIRQRQICLSWTVRQPALHLPSLESSSPRQGRTPPSLPVGDVAEAPRRMYSLAIFEAKPNGRGSNCKPKFLRLSIGLRGCVAEMLKLSAAVNITKKVIDENSLPENTGGSALAQGRDEPRVSSRIHLRDIFSGGRGHGNVPTVFSVPVRTRMVSGLRHCVPELYTSSPNHRWSTEGR